MSLYQHTPPLVIFKTSLLLTSILSAFSSQVLAKDWTYDGNSPNHQFYFNTYFDVDQTGDYVFDEKDNFSWTKDSKNQVPEAEKPKLDTTYGIYVNVMPASGVPSITFRNITGSFEGFKVENSALYGIQADIFSSSLEGEIVANNVHLSFTDVSAGDRAIGISSQGSIFKVSRSSVTFDKVNAVKRDPDPEIRGISFNSLNRASGYVNIDNTDVSIKNSITSQAKAFLATQSPSIQVKGTNLNVENSLIDSLQGYYIEGSSVDLQGNSISVHAGDYQSITAVELMSLTQDGEKISVKDNTMSIEGLQGGQTEITGLHLAGIEEVNNQANAQVSGNVISLKDSDVASLIVAYAEYRSNRHVFNSGNTTKFAGVNTIRGELSGFDRMEYDVSATNEKDAVLTLNSSIQNSFNDTTIKVNKGTDVQDGINYKLIAAVGSSAKFTNTTVESDATFVHSEWNVDDFTLNDGETLSVRWGEALDPDDPTDTPVLDPDNPSYQAVTENSKTLSESLLGTVAFLNQGAEFIADEGIAAMVASAKLGELSTFGAVHGGTSNYKTGSRVDVDGYTLAAGGSIKLSPDWVVGGFIEAGWADSDGHVGHAKGEGDHDYYGVGLATRYMLNDAWYVDGSMRVGQASTEFTGLYAGDSAKYDSDAFYVTAHAGTGYLFNLTDSVNLDVYGRYLVTYLDGDDVRLHNKYDDKFDMDSTVTHAVRVGGRLTGSFCPYAGWKVGLAYEHVFDGDAESAVNSLNLEVPSLEGDTGVMEVGVTMKPSLNSRWSMDLGAKGYAGDREGVTGSVMVRYAF